MVIGASAIVAKSASAVNKLIASDPSVLMAAAYANSLNRR